MNSSTALFDIDRLPCGVIEVSKKREILNCNQHVATMLDMSRDRLFGQRLDSVMSAASKIFIDSYIYPLLLEESFAQEVQLLLRSSGGKRIPAVVNITIEDGGASLWTFMACENRDKLYEELLSTRDTLSENTEELQKLYDQIQSEHDDMQVFCRSLSHDFIAPVRRAKQMIGLVIEDLEEKNLPVDEELKNLSSTTGNLDSLLMLIDGLLEFLRADSDVQYEHIVDLNDVVAESVRLNEEQWKGSVVVSIDELPTIAGSAAQLQVLFKNLIANAIKYCDTQSEIKITCDSTTQVDRHIISVHDNGIGMSSKYLEKIFEPFSRLHAQGEYTGSGLGLSIVKKMVSKHNADISVESVVGEGSTFSISFPVLEAREE